MKLFEIGGLSVGEAALSRTWKSGDVLGHETMSEIVAAGTTAS